MKQIGVVICAVALASGGPAIACDCLWYAEVALKKADLVADVRIGKLRFTGKNNATAYVTVLKGWKGVRTGERVPFRFDTGNSCASGIPQGGTTMRIAALRGKGNVYWPFNCLVEITRPESQHLLSHGDTE